MDRRHNSEDKHRFSRILRTQFRRYPEMNNRDLYKLAYQASFGSSHAIPNEKKAAERLHTELRNLRKGVPEPIFDVISPDGTVARINLRPYLAAGGDSESILKAFLKTAEIFSGSTDRMETILDFAADSNRSEDLEIVTEGLNSFLYRMKQKGYPAVHHSRRYRELYAPAYRVIAAEFFKYLDIQDSN